MSEGCPELTVPCVPLCSRPATGQQSCGCCPWRLLGESDYCSLQIHWRLGLTQTDLQRKICSEERMWYWHFDNDRLKLFLHNLCTKLSASVVAKSPPPQFICPHSYIFWSLNASISSMIYVIPLKNSHLHLNNMNCCFTIILFNFEQIKACGASGTGMQAVCQCFGHFRNFRILSPYRQTSIINVLSDTVTPFRQTSIINVLSDNVKFPFWLTSQTTAVCVAKFWLFLAKHG